MAVAPYDALRAELIAKKQELLARLERIGANLRRGFDSDSKEMAKELEDSEVVDALGNEAREEIARISATRACMAGRCGPILGASARNVTSTFTIRPPRGLVNDWDNTPPKSPLLAISRFDTPTMVLSCGASTKGSSFLQESRLVTSMEEYIRRRPEFTPSSLGQSSPR